MRDAGPGQEIYAWFREEVLGEIEQRTSSLLEMTYDSAHIEKQSRVNRIHDQAEGLQSILDELRESLLASVDQPGASIQDVEGKDIRRKGWDQTMDYDKEAEFARKALLFREMLDEMLLDPVIRSQIDNHLEFTKKIWAYEFGERFAVGKPFIIYYHMLTKISKGIALAEYVAIAYLLHQ